MITSWCNWGAAAPKTWS